MISQDALQAMLGAPPEVIEDTIFVPNGHNFGAGVHNGEVYKG